MFFLCSASLMFGCKFHLLRFLHEDVNVFSMQIIQRINPFLTEKINDFRTENFFFVPICLPDPGLLTGEIHLVLLKV